MNTPLVSLVIPGYKPDFFEQALRSAIGQTYPNIEIIVSDNCPSDAIEKICAKFNGVNYFRNPITGPKNVVGSLYLGSGEFVKPLFDDDILHPFCVEKMVRAMQLHESIALVFSASAHIDGNNHKTLVREPMTAQGMIGGNELYHVMLIRMTNVIGEFSTVLMRRDAIKRFQGDALFHLDGYDYSYGLADMVAFKNLMQDRHVYYLAEELSYFRRDDALGSNSNPAANKNFVHVVTDGVRLLLQAHDRALISSDELRECGKFVDNMIRFWGATYPVTEQFRAMYQERIAQIDRNAAQQSG